MEIRVVGVPVPQGSKRAFVNPKTGRAIVTEQAGKKHKDWRADVKAAALAAVATDGWSLVREGPVHLEIMFVFDRPQSHYNKAGTLMDASYAHPAPFWHSKTPDIDKLARAVLDALTGVVFKDDAQVSTLMIQKVYTRPGEHPGAGIRVSRIENGGQLIP